MKKRDLVKELIEMGWGPEEFSELLNQLRQKEKVNATQINEFLKEVGIPYGLLGRRYLVDAIKYVMNKKGVFYLEEMYYYIADKYGKTRDSVERAIRYAIGRAFDNANSKLERLFGSSINNQRGQATVLEFMNAAIKYFENPENSN